MADVVGTAYVRIKALTDQLAKDIEKDVKKGFSDAKLDKIAEDAGEDSGEAFGDGFSDGANKSIKKQSKDIIPTDDIIGDAEDSFQDAKKSFDQLDIFSGFRESFERNIQVDRASTDRALSRIREAQAELANFGDGGLFDIDFGVVDLPFDEGDLNNAIRRTRNSLAELGSELQDVDFDNFGDDLERLRARFEQLDIFSSFRESFERNIEVDDARVSRALQQIQRVKDELGEGFDFGTFDLPFDEGAFRNFFRRRRSELDDFQDDLVDVNARIGDVDLLGSLGDDTSDFLAAFRRGVDGAGDDLEDFAKRADRIDVFSGLRKSLDDSVDTDTIERFMARIRKNIADSASRGPLLDFGDNDFDLPFDEGVFSNFFRRIRNGFNDTNDDTQSFFGSVRSGFKAMGDDIRGGDLGKSLDSLQKKFANLGKTGGASLGLLRGALLLIGGAIVASLPFIQDIGAVILAYVTGLVAQIGFLATSLGGLGVAAAAALGSVALVALPIFLAFKTENEALDAFKDSIAATGEEFFKIGEAAQRGLLPALDEAFFILGDLIPIFEKFSEFVGGTVGAFALLASETLVGAESQGRLQQIMQSSARILEDLLPVLLDVGDILSGVWLAAAPAAERFVGILGDVIGRWRDMVDVGLATGTLERTFNLWFERARVLGSALADLSGALFDILQVGADSSDNVFRRFDDWAERFRAFTESEAGQNKLALIFDNALAVMREVNGVAVELFDGIFGRLTKVGGVDSLVEGLQKLQEVMPGLQEDFQELLDNIRTVVEVLGTNLWGRLTQTWDRMSEPLGRLVLTILDLVDAMNESGAFDTFLTLMQALSDTLSVLLSIPGFGTFIGYFIAFNAAIKISTLALGPFVRIFGTFMSGIIRMVQLRTGVALAGTASALTQFTTAMKAASAARAAGSFADGLSAGTKALGALQAASGAAAGAKGLKTVTDAAKGASSAAGATGLAGTLGTLVGSLGAFAIPLGIVGAGLAVVGTQFALGKLRTKNWEQEIRQATEAIGLLNDGLNITGDSVANYIETTSRFESNDQINDLKRLGFTVEELGLEVALGTVGFQDFADQALRTGEVFANVKVGEEVGGFTRSSIKSLDELGEKYDLTSEQLTKLSKGEEVYANGTRILLDGNDSLLTSFTELNNVIGDSVKANAQAFADNANNIRILGEDRLQEIADDIADASNANAVQIQVDANRELQNAAKGVTDEYTTLSDATRKQAHEQSILADGTVDYAGEVALLEAELQKQNIKIREGLELFSSQKFTDEFGLAKAATLNFIDVMNGANVFGAFKGFDGGVEALERLSSEFPVVGEAAQAMFATLQGLPEEEFNAAAVTMGIDAGVLRDAMNGANQAIIDLQNQAVESLPAIGELLADATKTREDGSQFFDKEGFIRGVNERISDTTAFQGNIKFLLDKVSREAALIAIQQGPEAAAALAEMAAANPEALKATLDGLAKADADLRNFISKEFGPHIAQEFATQAAFAGASLTNGLALGIANPATQKAVQDASLATLNSINDIFKGEFKIVDGKLDFIWTGHTSSPSTAARRVAGGRFAISEGGYVGDATYGTSFPGGPVGTDTVPAWLTPGEFVLRRAIAQSIPSKVLFALNSGDPRMLSVLTGALTRNRAGNAGAVVVAGAGAGTGASAGGSQMVISQMNIQAPSPIESARMVADRLRILNTQLTRP